MNNHQQQQQQQQKSIVKTNSDNIDTNNLDLRKFELEANFSAANFEYYKKYGDVTAPLVYRSYDGLNLLESGQKSLFRFYKKEETGLECSTTEAYKKNLTGTEVYIPHEEVEYHNFKAIDNFNRNFENDFGRLKLVETRDANHGYTKYWTFMSDKKHEVKVGDTVQFGMNFRNGIGTFISLGGDVYSYRLACLNGAVTTDKKMGSFNIPHRRSATRMLEKLTDGLSHMIQNYKNLLETYRAFSVTKLTQQLLNQILREVDIPLIYLPPHLVDVTTKREDKNIIGGNALIKLRRQDATLWDFFNSITEPLSRGIGMEAGSESFMTSDQRKKIKNIQFRSFVDKTSQLHRAMIPLIQVVKSK